MSDVFNMKEKIDKIVDYLSKSYLSKVENAVTVSFKDCTAIMINRFVNLWIYDK